MNEDTLNGEIEMLLREMQDSADLMHSWSTKLYRQADQLRRMSRGHQKLVQRLTIETGYGDDSNEESN